MEMHNVRINFAHNMTHSFIGISEVDVLLFKTWLSKDTTTDTTLVYEYAGAEFYLNREYVCSATIEPVQS